MKVTPAVGAERLTLLAKALQTAVDQGRYTFDLNCWVGEGENGSKRSDCGTAGCAVGFCPVVFPADWHYRDYKNENGGYPVVYNSAHEFGAKASWVDLFECAAHFFGLPHAGVARHLFDPDEYSQYAEDDFGSRQVPLCDVINRILAQAADMLEPV